MLDISPTSESAHCTVYITMVILSRTWYVQASSLCAYKGWSEDNACKLQFDEDHYFQSVLRSCQPSQGWFQFGGLAGIEHIH